MVGADPLQVGGQRRDRAAQLDDLAFEQVDALDVGLASGGEDVLFHGVDVGLDQIGDIEIAVDDVIGDRMHDRVGPERQTGGRRVELLADAGEPTVLTMADGDHEIGTDEDHDLAGFDDLASQRHGNVLDVVDRLEHQEQRVVVTLQLRSLMGVHGIFDRQRVQAEHVGDGLHLMFVGTVQADPGECLLARRLEFVHLVQRRGVGVLAGQAGAFAVDGAIHHGPRNGNMDRGGIRLGGLGSHVGSQ